MPNRDEYPQRPPSFAHKFTRLLFRVCAAQEIGTEATLLLVTIVHTEDAKRYKAPVTYWNDQLQSILGMSWGRLSRARQKAVNAGWLHYESGGKGQVGRYWVTIPKQFELVGDGATDEDFVLQNGDQSGERTGGEPGENRGTSDLSLQNGEANGDLSLQNGEQTQLSLQNGEQTGERTGGEPGENRGTSADLSTLDLNTTTKKKSARARFTPPTVDEVSAYCEEKGYGISPEKFLDYYASNGWKVGRNPMKDWRAAVRNWSRNDRSGGTKPTRGRVRSNDCPAVESIRI